MANQYMHAYSLTAELKVKENLSRQEMNMHAKFIGLVFYQYNLTGLK